MYLRDLWTVFRRRWYLVLSAVALVAMAGAAVFTGVPATYVAGADVVLVPPRNAENPDTNRLLDLGGLTSSVQVLTRSLTSEETAGALRREAPDADYEVVADPTTSAPILNVEVSAATKAAAARMLSAVLGRIPDNLRDLQVALDIKPVNQLTSVVISRDSPPHADQKSRIRAVGAAVVLLGALLALGIALLDGWLVRRRGDGAAGGPSAGPIGRGSATPEGRSARVSSDPAPRRRPPSAPPRERARV